MLVLKLYNNVSLYLKYFRFVFLSCLAQPEFELWFRLCRFQARINGEETGWKVSCITGTWVYVSRPSLVVLRAAGSMCWFYQCIRPSRLYSSLGTSARICFIDGTLGVNQSTSSQSFESSWEIKEKLILILQSSRLCR